MLILKAAGTASECCEIDCLVAIKGWNLPRRVQIVVRDLEVLDTVNAHSRRATAEPREVANLPDGENDRQQKSVARS